MALLHGGSLVLPDGISYHSPLQSISKFEEDHRLIKNKINKANHPKKKAAKKVVLKKNSLPMLSNVGNNGIWNLKETSNKENFLTCASPTKSNDTTVSSARSTIYSAQDFASEKFSLIRGHSNSDMFLNSRKSIEYNFSNFRVDLERELAQEAVEEDEEDEGGEEAGSIFEVSASPYMQNDCFSKVCGSVNNCCSSSKPIAISVPNLSLKNEESLKGISSTQKMNAATDTSLEHLKKKGIYVSNISSSLSKTSIPNVSSLSAVAYNPKDDSVCDNRIIVNSQVGAPMLLSHAACSFENHCQSKPCYLSSHSFYPALMTDVNNLAVLPSQININQGHVFVRLEDNKMMLYQTLTSNNFNKESEQLVPNALSSSSRSTSEAVIRDSDMDFSQAKNSQLTGLSITEFKSKNIPLQESTKQNLEKEILSNSKFIGDVSNYSASNVVDIAKDSGNQSLSYLPKTAAINVSCLAATQAALDNLEILRNPYDRKSKPDLATETPGLTLLKDASAALSLLPKTKCIRTMAQSAFPLVFQSTSKATLHSACQTVPQRAYRPILQSTTNSVRSRSPSASLLHCTAYNTRSKRNSIRSDGGAAKIDPKITKGGPCATRYKEDTDDDCNIYKKTYKTYSVMKNGFAGLTDSLCKILPSAENDVQKFQMSSFIKSSRYGINSPLLMELGLLNSKPVKINPYLSRELTYDIGIQPVKKRCSAAWDSIPHDSCCFTSESKVKEELNYLPNGVVTLSSITSDVLDNRTQKKEAHGSSATTQEKEGNCRIRTRLQQYVLVEGCSSDCKRRQIESGNLPLKQHGLPKIDKSRASQTSSSTFKNYALQFCPNHTFPRSASNSSCMPDVRLGTLRSANDLQNNSFSLPHSSGCCDRSVAADPSLTATNNSGISSKSALKLPLDLKMHKKAKNRCNEGSFEKNMNSLQIKDQTSSNSNSNAADGFRRRKYRGKKTNINGNSKCNVVLLEESCGNISREVDNNVSLPPARGVWFDSKRNLWRASWRENGSLRTKGFSIGDLGLHEARIQAVAYRIARVPDMEIPPDLIGILSQNSDRTTAVRPSISSLDLKSLKEPIPYEINESTKSCVSSSVSASLLPSINKILDGNEKPKEDFSSFGLSKNNNNNFVDMNLIGTSKNNNQALKIYELNENSQRNESRTKEHVKCELQKKKFLESNKKMNNRNEDLILFNNTAFNNVLSVKLLNNKSSCNNISANHTTSERSLLTCSGSFAKAERENLPNSVIDSKRAAVYNCINNDKNFLNKSVTSSYLKILDSSGNFPYQKNMFLPKEQAKLVTSDYTLDEVASLTGSIECKNKHIKVEQLEKSGISF